jgi:RimK family alpha-L-glutamate ligase
MRVVLAANAPTATNLALLEAFERCGARAELGDGLCGLLAGPGDLVLGRYDVLPDLSGVDPGLFGLASAADAGAFVANGADTLLACHDKLLTSLLLDAVRVPHPPTQILHAPDDPLLLEPPVVVKPRFGSWGDEVHRCETRAELAGVVAALAERPWFPAQGVLVQELVPPRGRDLRVVVASGRVVGAIARVAAPGEWRTNVALGAVRVPVVPPLEACELALRAAAAVRGDLVGVDLLPTDDGWAVLELNGAVDFTVDYSLDGDVFDAAAGALLEAADERLAAVA